MINLDEAKKLFAMAMRISGAELVQDGRTVTLVGGDADLRHNLELIVLQMRAQGYWGVKKDYSGKPYRILFRNEDDAANFVQYLSESEQRKVTMAEAIEIQKSPVQLVSNDGMWQAQMVIPIYAYPFVQKQLEHYGYSALQYRVRGKVMELYKTFSTKDGAKQTLKEWKGVKEELEQAAAAGKEVNKLIRLVNATYHDPAVANEVYVLMNSVNDMDGLVKGLNLIMPKLAQWEDKEGKAIYNKLVKLTQ